MLGIRNKWLAWQVDEIVCQDGRVLDAKLNERDDKGKLKNKAESVFRRTFRSSGKGIVNIRDLMKASGAEEFAL